MPINFNQSHFNQSLSSWLIKTDFHQQKYYPVTEFRYNTLNLYSVRFLHTVILPWDVSVQNYEPQVV